MADIRPFNGVHYNPSLIKDMAKVICPPYDIISPQMQQELYRRSEYNFVRIEYGLEFPHDKSADNKYTRAAATLRDWLIHQILITDDKRSLYIDEHTFTYQGKPCCRRSVNCLVKLEDWSKMVVRPHEGTLSKAKSDRLNMLWSLRANTSPIMALYEDKERNITPVIDKHTGKKPLLTVNKAGDESHRVWAITSEEAISKIRGHLADQPLYIADGHHRYESALNYQRERRTAASGGRGEEPFDFVMMTLVDIEDPGLVILPAHRLVGGIAPPAIGNLAARLPAFFHIKEAGLNKTRLRTQINNLLTEKKDGNDLLLYGLRKDRFLSLSLRDSDAIRPMFPAFHSELYQTLDVSIVDHVILEELLGLTHEKAGSFLAYANDAVQAIEQVRSGEYQLSIIVNPVKPGTIKAIADSGDRMPKKSTYFYPKAPAGLISYRF